jgi:ABC-2 type transport system ATP-binding protein
LNSKPLVVSSLSRSFGGLRAVDELCFELQEGEIFGFLGPNGAGKSTTLKMLTGFLKPTSGKIRVYGYDPFHDGMKVKPLIGVVPEELQFYDRLSGREFLEFTARMFQVEDYSYHVENLLELLDLKDQQDQFILEYSHGMKKKLALASALIHRPKILFLDEPFTGMDALSVIKVRKFLESLKEEGVTIFFSSHILEIVEKISDRIGIIMKAKLLGVGSSEELTKKFGAASLEDVFLKDAF